MSRTLRFADEETRERLWARAEYLANANRTQPICHCGLGMLKDNFNGMWHCREQGHGGYQTRDQVAAYLYRDALEGEGYDG